MQGLERMILLSLLVYVPSLRLWGCLQLWFGPSKRIVGGKHLEHFNFIAAKTFASCGRRRVLTRAKYAEALDWFLLLPPIHHGNLRAFRATSRQETTDWCVLRRTYEKAEENGSLLQWILPHGLEFHAPMTSRVKQQRLKNCFSVMNASEGGKHQRERLKGTERLWKTVYHGSKRMSMKHPEERFVSFRFGLQVTPKRTSCYHVWSTGQAVCILRIDVMWRNFPTEVYIDFSRPARRWKGWCLLDNDGRWKHFLGHVCGILQNDKLAQRVQTKNWKSVIQFSYRNFVSWLQALILGLRLGIRSFPFFTKDSASWSLLLLQQGSDFSHEPPHKLGHFGAVLEVDGHGLKSCQGMLSSPQSVSTISKPHQSYEP